MVPLRLICFSFLFCSFGSIKKRKKETTLDSENNFILWCGYKFFLRTHRKIVKNESGMLSVPHPGSHSPLFPSFWWRRQAMAEAEKKGLTLQTLALRQCQRVAGGSIDLTMLFPGEGPWGGPLCLRMPWHASVSSITCTAVIVISTHQPSTSPGSRGGASSEESLLPSYSQQTPDPSHGDTRDAAVHLCCGLALQYCRP